RSLPSASTRYQSRWTVSFLALNVFMAGFGTWSGWFGRPVAGRTSPRVVEAESKTRNDSGPRPAPQARLHCRDERPRRPRPPRPAARPGRPPRPVRLVPAGVPDLPGRRDRGRIGPRPDRPGPGLGTGHDPGHRSRGGPPRPLPGLPQLRGGVPRGGRIRRPAGAGPRAPARPPPPRPGAAAAGSPGGPARGHGGAAAGLLPGLAAAAADPAAAAAPP